MQEMEKDMKTTGKALIGAAVLTFAGLAVNLIFHMTGRIIPLAYTMYGGECIIDMGFGIRVTHIYSMTMGGSDSVDAGFDPVSFIVCFVLIYLIVLILRKIARRMIRK